MRLRTIKCTGTLGAALLLTYHAYVSTLRLYYVQKFSNILALVILNLVSNIVILASLIMFALYEEDYVLKILTIITLTLLIMRDLTYIYAASIFKSATAPYGLSYVPSIWYIRFYTVPLDPLCETILYLSGLAFIILLLYMARKSANTYFITSSILKAAILATTLVTVDLIVRHYLVLNTVPESIETVSRLSEACTYTTKILSLAYSLSLLLAFIVLKPSYLTIRYSRRIKRQRKTRR